MRDLPLLICPVLFLAGFGLTSFAATTLSCSVPVLQETIFTQRDAAAVPWISGLLRAGRIRPIWWAKIAADYPSFAQQWMDDRTRTLAALWILQHQKPRLTLLHLVDLDSEEHDNAPFTRESLAIVERTDELIGDIVAALPAGAAVAIVSDHGFERVDKISDGVEERCDRAVHAV